MKDLIIYLQFIYVISKTIHYNYRGDNFLSVHKYMDEISEPIQDEFIDGIKEKYFMANGEIVPSFEDIYEEILPMIKTVKSDCSLPILYEQMRMVVYKIDQLSRDSSLHAGTVDLLGKIASHFQTNIALIGALISPKK